MIDFPNSPTVGQIFTDPGGAGSWKWDGTKWVTYVPPVATGTVTQVATGTGLTGGPITTTGTISMAASGVTAGAYQGLTVDATGRVTAAVNQNYAPLADPVFTGDPQAPTPTAGDNDTSIATTAFVRTALTAAAIGAPNKLINPFMEIDQANEGASVACITTGYGYSA